MTRAPGDDALDVLARIVREERSSLADRARREGLGAEDAVDCVHDALCTFLDLALRDQVPPDASEQSRLLGGIVVNTARNKRRRHHLARPHRTLDVEPPDGGPTSEALVANAEECVRLRACMNRLCHRQRTVVMMRLLEERPGDDVAAALGLSRGHVDVLLHRARASLLVCMTENDEEAPP
jgi:RNA polymerase sigma-70 factor, ECF subfamily